MKRIESLDSYGPVLGMPIRGSHIHCHWGAGHHVPAWRGMWINVRAEVTAILNRESR